MLGCWDIWVRNYLDIQAEWADPDKTKGFDSLVDITGFFVDKYYLIKKNGFNKNYHERWAENLCDEQIEYVVRNAYACYIVWALIDFIKQGQIAAKDRPVMSAIHASINKTEKKKLKLEKAHRRNRFG
jgi:hypothetical protein